MPLMLRGTKFNAVFAYGKGNRRIEEFSINSW